VALVERRTPAGRHQRWWNGTIIWENLAAMLEGFTARQFWIHAPGRGEIVRAHIPSRRPHEVLVRTLFTGISRGTESLVFRGDVPVSQYADMRAPFQEGDLPGPVKYGYTNVGRVEEADLDSSDLAGRTIFCLFPHQDVYCVPATRVTPVPVGVPAARAVLGASMETALNAVWDAQPAPGDRIVVVGAGVIGLLVAWLCRQIPGADVTVVDVNPAREQVAQELELSFRTDPPRRSDADLVVHASGNPEGLIAALALGDVEARIVDVSWYGTQSVRLPLGEAFHSRRLKIESSQVGRIPPHRAARWTYARRLALALELLRESRLDVLITGESEFDDLPQALATLAYEPGNALCHRIRYPPSG
jgi:threonine dehydrogenase-like Zn-dependent dehydrogenase